jgi:hypothetical protein
LRELAEVFSKPATGTERVGLGVLGTGKCATGTERVGLGVLVAGKVYSGGRSRSALSISSIERADTTSPAQKMSARARRSPGDRTKSRREPVAKQAYDGGAKHGGNDDCTSVRGRNPDSEA